MAAKDEMFRLLGKLCSLISVSGFEDEIRDVVVEELKTSADDVRINAMGNVIALKRGSSERPVSPKSSSSAHDEKLLI